MLAPRRLRWPFPCCEASPTALEQDRRGLVLSANAGLDASWRERGRYEPLDQPGAGGVHLLDLRQIDYQARNRAFALESPASPASTSATVRVVQLPDKRQLSTPPSSRISTMRVGICSAGVAGACFRVGVGQHANCLIPSRCGCHFDRQPAAAESGADIYAAVSFRSPSSVFRSPAPSPSRADRRPKPK